MTLSRFTRPAVALAALSLLATSLPAQEIEEIVVTARKRTESVQDIPLSISVFDEEAIAAAGIRDIDDIARLTPGLVFDKGWIPQDTRPHIRGLPTDRGRAPVGILVDGIDISSESMLTSGGGMLMNLKVMDIERIEVVKGPQSALYGRVAFGGAVNYVSRAPSDEMEASFSADVGDYGQMEARVGVSFPVSETLGLRINAVTAQHDGYYENEVSGEGIGGSDSTGVSAAAAFRPSDTFKLDLRVAYSSDEYEIRPQMQLASKTGHADPVPLPPHVVGVLGPPTFGAPIPYPANVFAPPPGPITLLDRITASLNPYTGEDFEGSTFDSLLLHARAEWDFGGAKLNAWLGSTSAETTQNMDVDYYGEPWQPVFLPSAGVNEPLPAQFMFDLDTEIDQTNLELRLGDLESDGFRWAVGGLYWNEEVRQQNGNLIVLIFFPPIASAGQNVAAQNPITKRDEGRDTDHWSAYGIVEYDFNDRLTGSVEARYSDESTDTYWTVGGNGMLGVAFAPIPVNNNPTASRGSEDSFFTPRFTLEYEYSDDVLTYASIAKGIKPGGVSTIASPNPLTARFAPEELWSYEAGFKSTLADGRVTLNAAAFFMDYEGKQTTSLEPSTTAATGFDLVVGNAGAAEIKGFEVEAALGLTEELVIRGGYTWLDSEYTDFVTLTNSALSIGLVGDCTLQQTPAGFFLCSVDETGVEMERVPQHNLNVSASYTRAVGNGMNFQVDLLMQYQSERGIARGRRNVFDSWVNVDARIGLQAERWSVFAYVDNVTGDDTVRTAQSSGDFFALGNLATVIFAPDKRQAGVRFSYSM
ncbi:MAG: TonB-dependent receptor [Gammaproteobacteria bacterium]|nr:TonB-dependent receptor [Gammaproteobacteria bacterium]